MIPNPVQRARRLIKKYGYKNPDEIDLIELLYAEGLYLKYETTDAYQGKIVYNNRTGIITLNHNLENEYQKRYVVAHEMGHFFNERNKPNNNHSKLPEEVKHEFKKDRYQFFIDKDTKLNDELTREKEANQFLTREIKYR